MSSNCPADRRSGPKRKLTDALESALLNTLSVNRDVPVGRIAAMYGISRQTVYNIRRRHREKGADALISATPVTTDPAA